MQYNKIDTPLVDAIMLIDHDDPQPLSLQQNKILQKNLIRKYRLALFLSLILLLICLLVLLIKFSHKDQYYHINNSPVLPQSSKCVIDGGCEHFTRIENWDYPHNDMFRTIVNDYETCCSMCWHQTSCMVFAYSPATQACWIKTKLTDDGGYFHPDRISGVLGACTNEKRINSWNYPDNNMFDNEMNGSIPASDWKTCCGLCAHQTFCKAYTFSFTTHQCWLKTKIDNGIFDADKISGNKN